MRLFDLYLSCCWMRQGQDFAAQAVGIKQKVSQYS